MPDNASGAAGDGVIWHPTEEVIRNSNLYYWMKKYQLDSYEDLYNRSIREPDWFWDAFVKEIGIHWIKPYERVSDASRGIEWTQWFISGLMNIGYDCADKHAADPRLRRKTAVRWEDESGQSGELTYEELAEQSSRLANGLRALGIKKGDAIGLLLPMIPQAVVALLAIAKIGAIATPVFSGFSAAAVAQRLQDCGASLIITVEGYHRKGRLMPLRSIAEEAADISQTVKHVLVIEKEGAAPPSDRDSERIVYWNALMQEAESTFTVEPMDANDPMLIIYTSGTTGNPKGVVHSQIGFPLKAAQDMHHAFDFKPDDTFFWYTDLGWMMGPWVVFGTLLHGATVLLYDGSPDYPGVDRIWSLIDKHQVTHLGLSPTLIRSLMVHGDEPLRKLDLSSLRVLGSTGEPWNEKPYRWYFEHVGGGRCPIINYSGGTEVSGGILASNILFPIKPMSFHSPILGMHADVVDEQCQPVRGQEGELVLRNALPGMTRGLWNDRQRYLDSYWSRWPGVWMHGDAVYIDEDGYWYIRGRSDDTMSVAGKRVGPAEIESAAVSHPAVIESAAIGIPHPVKGEAICVFAVLKPGTPPDDALKDEITQQVSRLLGKAMRPDKIEFVGDLPKNRSGKIVRRMIKAAYLGKDPGDLTMLQNPDALQSIQSAQREEIR